MIFGSSFREKFRMIVVRPWSYMFPVRKYFRNHINIIKFDFSLVWLSEMYCPFYFWMNSLVFSNYYIISRFPLESSLSSYDIIWIDFSPSEYFYSEYLIEYPKRLPAESLVFWVDEACILDASKNIVRVSWLKPKQLDKLEVILFICIMKKYLLIQIIIHHLISSIHNIQSNPIQIVLYEQLFISGI